MSVCCNFYPPLRIEMKMNSNRGSKQDEELYFVIKIHQNTAVSVVFNNAFHFSL